MPCNPLEVVVVVVVVFVESEIVAAVVDPACSEAEEMIGIV